MAGGCLERGVGGRRGGGMNKLYFMRVVDWTRVLFTPSLA